MGLDVRPEKHAEAFHSHEHGVTVSHSAGKVNDRRRPIDILEPLAHITAFESIDRSTRVERGSHHLGSW